MEDMIGMNFQLTSFIHEPVILFQINLWIFQLSEPQRCLKLCSSKTENIIRKLK